jgi:6,7-dimethyl-8-ribityllumazine synthase
MNTLQGSTDGRGLRIAIVAARFNERVTTKLVDAALAALRSHGVHEDAIDVAWVPGAFEIPFAAQRLASGGAYDAIVCLGAIIRGDTEHFDLVAREAARGIADVSRSTGIPVVFEVLATQNLAQAEARAGGSHGNKGRDAAEAALEMARLAEVISRSPSPGERSYPS